MRATLMVVTSEQRRVRTVIAIGYLIAGASVVPLQYDGLVHGYSVREQLQSLSFILGQVVVAFAYWTLSTHLAPSAHNAGVRRAFRLLASANAILTVGHALNAWWLQHARYFPTRFKVANYIELVASIVISVGYWLWAGVDDSALPEAETTPSP